MAVLLVADNETALAALAAALADLELAVEHCPPNGLGDVEWHRFLTVLCDAELGRETLLESVRVVRGADEDIALAIVVLLRAEEFTGVPEAIEAGADDCLRWPLPPELLGVRIGMLGRLSAHRREKHSTTTYLSHLAHDLRMPLFSLDGTTKLLADPTVGPLNQTQTELLNSLLNAVAQASELSDEFRDLAQLRRDSIILARTALDLEPLVAEVIDVHGPHLRDRDLSVINRTEGIPAPLFADARRLRRVLANLLTNAIRHSPRGGRIEVDTIYDSRTCCWSVSDEGPGIPPADRERIFERRVQLEPRHGGSGLGLGISKELVLLHNGEIGVGESATGGARLWIRLPLYHDGSPALHVADTD